jgi:hypothetical protein
MTRFSPQKSDEVTDKGSDDARRRTKPRVEGRPLSPRAIDRVYAETDYPLGRGGKTHEHQKNQFHEDFHDKNYDNETKGWVRGQGSVNGALYPSFDHGKLDPASKPPRPATGLKASGTDCHKSPFSAAYRKGAGEGF